MKNNIKRIMFVLLIAGLSLYPMTALSQEAEVVEGAPAPEMAAMTISGIVVSVDLQAQSVVVERAVELQEGAIEAVVLYFSEVSQILKDGAVVTSADLKEGDQVTAEVIEDAEGNKSIKVLVVLSEVPAFLEMPAVMEEPLVEAPIE